ncbi:CsbD family protein [Streptomyces sp. NPDC057020]|uniref:CsbD family protein n=1 Tax=unclassified Streptomyces TaxID=2593676 RepID=UPI000940056B|nr:CsbD family protein [Streptomyces sp. CB02009]OKJ63425.1 general stress protein CsbD [Streptomyces sp. CB02009]
MTGKGTEKAKGKRKEAAGKAAGDKRLETEGKTDQVKAKVREAGKAVSERAKGVRDSLDPER